MKTQIYTITGNPITKKNSMRILRSKNGRPFLRPSKQYEAYEKEALRQLNQEEIPETITEPVNIQVVYYMETHRRVDLANLLEATTDILQRTTPPIIKDDCAEIVASHDGSRVMYDKENPRAEITIERITAE